MNYLVIPKTHGECAQIYHVVTRLVCSNATVNHMMNYTGYRPHKGRLGILIYPNDSEIHWDTVEYFMNADYNVDEVICAKEYLKRRRKRMS